MIKLSPYNYYCIPVCLMCVNANCAGKFNVSEHIEAEKNSAHKALKPVLLGLGLVVVAMGRFLMI